ncbi:MAG: phosphotriesterase, partial [Acidobacteria bacterium]|nr:phosphotriesterase [Acidobacteriota bacterium]
EFEEGIEGTGIRPGIIKTGIDAGPLSAIDAKLIRAAARTHLRTGLAVAVHSGDGTAALAALKLFQEERAPAHAFLWVHAQNEPDIAKHLRAARAGAWVEFDGIREGKVLRHVELAKTMRAHALLDRTLVSQDAGWYHVGEPGGGNFRSYETLFTRFIPSALDVGFTENDLQMLLVANPGRALLAAPPLARFTA